jgi:hypothetical protein
MQIQTTLAQGAPWPAHTYTPNASRIGMRYAPRKDKGTVKPIKVKDKVILLQYIAKNPGQSMLKIRTNMAWSRPKIERVMTEIRAEVGKGYFLLADLKVSDQRQSA